MLTDESGRWIISWVLTQRAGGATEAFGFLRQPGRVLWRRRLRFYDWNVSLRDVGSLRAETATRPFLLPLEELRRSKEFQSVSVYQNSNLRGHLSSFCFQRRGNPCCLSELPRVGRAQTTAEVLCISGCPAASVDVKSLDSGVRLPCSLGAK